jgi:hypothetical protein
MTHQILTFYADAFGTVRVEVWRKKEKLGSFGLLGDNAVPFAPGARVQLSTRRLERVAAELKLFGEGPHEYRRPPDPHRDYSADDEPQPDTTPDEPPSVDDAPDSAAVPPGVQKPARERRRNQ